MKCLIVLAAVSALAIARPELYKEQEDFQFSRSSSDDGSKSGFYGAQRGNMGGNYERAHNMDSLAQNQMSGLVRQVEGELGDGVKTKTGSVYSAANSRGLYGSGHYDLSNLAGRNFQDTYYGNSQARSAQAQSSSDFRSAGYENSRSQSYGGSWYGGNQRTRSDAQTQTDDLQSLVSQSSNHYVRQPNSNSGHHSSSAFQVRSENDDIHANAHSGYESNVRTRLISATPVRIILTPGRHVAVPVAAQTYDANYGASALDVNALNTDQSILSQDSLYTPNNATKYESSYSYKKKWEKHDTIPTTYVVSPTNIPKNSELYEDSETRGSENSYSAHGLDSRLHTRLVSGGFDTAKTSSGNSRYNSNYNTQHQDTSNANSNAFTQTRYNIESNAGASSDSLIANSQAQHARTGYHASLSDSSLNAQRQASQLSSQTDLNSQVENLNSKPKSYQSSYSYHKSWERQGDPYVIKPASSDYFDGQSAQRFTSSAVNGRYTSLNAGSQHSHNHEDCDEHRYKRAPLLRVLNQESIQQQNIDNTVQNNNLEQQSSLGQQSEQLWGNLGQQSETSWENLNNFGQQSENLADLGQQSQTTWDKTDDLGQQSQTTWDKADDLGQQSQATWETAKDLGQQSQATWEAAKDLGQQSQATWETAKDLGQQSQATSWAKIEDLGQQSQGTWGNEDSGQQSQGTWGLVDLGQQSQGTWDNADLGQQSLNTWDKIQDLGQTATNWEQADNVALKSYEQNAENFNQVQNKNGVYVKAFKVPQASNSHKHSSKEYKKPLPKKNGTFERKNNKNTVKAELQGTQLLSSCNKMENWALYETENSTLKYHTKDRTNYPIEKVMSRNKSFQTLIPLLLSDTDYDTVKINKDTSVHNIKNVELPTSTGLENAKDISRGDIGPEEIFSKYNKSSTIKGTAPILSTKLGNTLHQAYVKTKEKLDSHPSITRNPFYKNSSDFVNSGISPNNTRLYNTKINKKIMTEKKQRKNDLKHTKGTIKYAIPQQKLNDKTLWDTSKSLRQQASRWDDIEDLSQKLQTNIENALNLKNQSASNYKLAENFTPELQLEDMWEEDFQQGQDFLGENYEGSDEVTQVPPKTKLSNKLKTYKQNDYHTGFKSESYNNHSDITITTQHQKPSMTQIKQYNTLNWKTHVDLNIHITLEDSNPLLKLVNKLENRGEKSELPIFTPHPKIISNNTAEKNIAYDTIKTESIQDLTNKLNKSNQKIYNSSKLSLKLPSGSLNDEGSDDNDRFNFVEGFPLASCKPLEKSTDVERGDIDPEDILYTFRPNCNITSTKVITEAPNLKESLNPKDKMTFTSTTDAQRDFVSKNALNIISNEINAQKEIIKNHPFFIQMAQTPGTTNYTGNITDIIIKQNKQQNESVRNHEKVNKYLKNANFNDTVITKEDQKNSYAGQDVSDLKKTNFSNNFIKEKEKYKESDFDTKAITNLNKTKFNYFKQSLGQQNKHQDTEQHQVLGIKSHESINKILDNKLAHNNQTLYESQKQGIPQGGIRAQKEITKEHPFFIQMAQTPGTTNNTVNLTDVIFKENKEQNKSARNQKENQYLKNANINDTVITKDQNNSYAGQDISKLKRTNFSVNFIKEKEIYKESDFSMNTINNSNKTDFDYLKQNKHQEIVQHQVLGTQNKESINKIQDNTLLHNNQTTYESQKHRKSRDKFSENILLNLNKQLLQQYLTLVDITTENTIQIFANEEQHNIKDFKIQNESQHKIDNRNSISSVPEKLPDDFIKQTLQKAIVPSIKP